jgi:hypothetical protein
MPTPKTARLLWPVIAKLSRYRHAGDKGERKYSSYAFLISTLDGVSGQRHAVNAIPPVPIVQESGRALELI